MGLGADLLWTPVLRALQARNGKRIVLCDRPRLSDFLAGADHDRASKRRLSPVFEGNPFVEFPPVLEKSALSRWLDRIGETLIGFNRLKSQIEDSCYRRTRNNVFKTIYLDLPHHSYVAASNSERYMWKPGGHIIDILAASVSLSGVPHQCEFFFKNEEKSRVEGIIGKSGFSRFITIEPNTNPGFFGDLRAWPFERWQAVVGWIEKNHPGTTVVQVGSAGGRILDGVVNMCGVLSFRETAIMIGRSFLFLGTEGGLMHTANAVKTRALAVWGGLTDPSFAAYPEKDEIVHVGAPCAPCGLLGHCPNNHRCMLDISVERVINKLSGMIE